MKFSNWRIYLGILLLVLGVLFLLQTLGLFQINESILSLAISAAFASGGLIFISVLLSNKKENWWATIPGIALIDLGVIIAWSTLLPDPFDDFTGSLFLAGISLSFWIVYAISPQQWWAIIPGGVLMTLAIVAGIGNTALEIGGIFFLGLSLTFALVALLPRGQYKMSWPWIPAGIMGTLGLVLMLSAENLFVYVWPAGLILAGIFLVYRSFLKK